ncbi:DUF1659 domain-containing protein [Selenomonas sp.]|uniref:DUF1659 domain-containing protein n=1 Tax=Selenomonas sp. TaxID=2053611 RepID=UPI0025CC5C27|nr:DUF1659 domain-containing protein [Selenomonas sp.]MCI6086528.1 DUF1659 domain-containing protein [Selenomonas sp.]MDY3297745.1 DUF1659 domain-containing protein [Selenomonas sp.]MDY4415527.1 DUF1659 domain-containing protein [Selenomonas sp.]
MAAKKESQSTKLVIKVVTGTASSGKAITSSRTYSAVNPAVTDDDMLDIGAKLGALQSHDVSTISRVDTATLVAGE